MRFNTGPVVVDIETAETCRKNFISALDDFSHPVYSVMMTNLASIYERHIDCDCYACRWLERDTARRKAVKREKTRPVSKPKPRRKPQSVNHVANWIDKPLTFV